MKELRAWVLASGDPELLHPGELAPASGQYAILDGEGARTGKERTVVQGKHLPPTPEAGQVYVLVDATRNAAGVPASS